MEKVTEKGKHSSLLSNEAEYDRKKFIVRSPGFFWEFKLSGFWHPLIISILTE